MPDDIQNMAALCDQFYGTLDILQQEDDAKKLTKTDEI